MFSWERLLSKIFRIKIWAIQLPCKVIQEHFQWLLPMLHQRDDARQASPFRSTNLCAGGHGLCVVGGCTSSTQVKERRHEVWSPAWRLRLTYRTNLPFLPDAKWCAVVRLRLKEPWQNVNVWADDTCVSIRLSAHIFTCINIEMFACGAVLVRLCKCAPLEGKNMSAAEHAEYKCWHRRTASDTKGPILQDECIIFVLHSKSVTMVRMLMRQTLEMLSSFGPLKPR